MDIAVKPSMVASVVTRAAKVQRPIFIWGPPGIGKSEIVVDIAHNRFPGNNHLIDLRLALMEPTDLRGFPYRDEASNQMEWAPPADLPSAELAALYDWVFLFLDELNSAPPSVQAAAYQLILNRRIGRYVLPGNVIIIAAGNRENDRGVTYRMPAPLANRFRHIAMQVDFDDWQQWAINNNIHPDVIGYLSYHKGDLFQFDAKSASTAWASPRSWTYVSEILGDDTFDSVPDMEQKVEVSGAVGEGMSGRFLEHRRVASKMPKPEDILTGQVTKLDPAMKGEISAKYAMIVATTYEVNRQFKNGVETDALNSMLNYGTRFMVENADPEMVVVYLRTIMRDYKIPFNWRKVLDKDLLETISKKYTKYLL